MKKGGKRERAGRPPKKDGVAKSPYSTSLGVKVKAFLQATPNASELIDDMVRGLKAFKEWDSRN